MALTEEQRVKFHAYQKEWRVKNADKIKARMKLYRQKNSTMIAARNKAYRELNKEKIQKSNKAYREDNKDQIKLSGERYRALNADHISRQSAIYRDKNSEQIKAQSREYRRKNPKVTRRSWMIRRKTVDQQQPAWASQAAINSVYLQARQLTEDTGIQFHVDHVIPLKGKLVSGLHCESNLQILTATENLKKGASFDG